MDHRNAYAARRRPTAWARAIAALLGVWCLNALALPQDLILVFDNSRSMRKADPEFLARTAARDFLKAFDGDHRIGVLVFDDKVNQTAALDQPAARATALDRVDYRGRLTNSPAAVERALYELKTLGRANASKVIVFMTDGLVDTGNAALDVDRTRWLREDLSTEAATGKVRIFGMAFTEAADIQLMKALTEATGGSFERAYAPADMAGAFARLRTAIDAAPAAAAAASLTPAERASLEQMSRETGVPMAQLLQELADGEKTSPQVVANAVQVASATSGTTAPAAPPAAAVGPPSDSGGFGVAAMGVLALALALGGWLFLRRRPARLAPAVTGAVKATPVAARTAQPAKVPEAWLIDSDGHAGLPPRRLSAKPLMVGRVGGDDGDQLDYYVVDQGTVGRRHAVIKVRDGAFWVIDQGSVNGTFVNGQRVAGEHRLRNGDHLKFHKYEFEFQLPGGSSSEATMVGMGSDKTLVASLDSTLVAGSAAALATMAVAAAKGAPAGAAATLIATPPPSPAVAHAAASRGEADDMFDDVVPAAAQAASDDFFAAPVPPAVAAQDIDLLAETAPPTADLDLDDVLGETVQRSPGALASDSPADLLAETALRPDALGETFLRADSADLDADASGFFNDLTFRPASLAPAAGELDAELDVLDVTAPQIPKAAEAPRPSRDFYTATTIIPTAVLPDEMPERTLVLKAPPLPATPPVAPPLPAPRDEVDDFFMLEPPAPVAKPEASFADFDLADPVIELPLEPSSAAPPVRVYNLDFTQEVPRFDDDDPPLSEQTIVLPSSPLARGQRPPE